MGSRSLRSSSARRTRRTRRVAGALLAAAARNQALGHDAPFHRDFEGLRDQTSGTKFPGPGSFIRRAWVQAWALASLRDDRGHEPIRRIYPDSGGLLAGWDSGGIYFWDTSNPDPDRWRVFVGGRPVDPPGERHDLTLTAYLDGLHVATSRPRHSATGRRSRPRSDDLGAPRAGERRRARCVYCTCVDTPIRIPIDGAGEALSAGENA